MTSTPLLGPLLALLIVAETPENRAKSDTTRPGWVKLPPPAWFRRQIDQAVVRRFGVTLKSKVNP